MEPYCKRLQTALVIVFLIALLGPGYASASTPGEDTFDEEAVISRLRKLKNDIVAPQYNSIVRSYLMTYTQRRRDAAQRIIGRTVVYFPLFEEYLRRHNLPEDLKYLPIVESALEPRAVSTASAVGLWQFMPSTARWIGLEINGEVDERCDPHRSTDAALTYLARLYNQFDDWELAIAAYNGGGGRVSRAIKRARSKDFWEIRRFLPRETSNYVPAFIAAYYLMHHYEEHNLVPEYPDLDMQLTKTVSIYDRVTFYEIAQITGLSLDVIEQLNPSYTKAFIPESTGGRYLTLPSRVMGAFEDYLNSQRPDPNGESPLVSTPVFVTRPAGTANGEYVRSTYTVRKGDYLQQVAAALGCTVYQLRAWNQLSSDELAPGQQLIVFSAKEVRRFAAAKKMEEFAPVATLLPQEVVQENTIWVREQKSFVTKGGYLYYHAQRPERVFELAQRLPNIGVRDLMQLNGFKNPLQEVKPDSYVRVRKL